MSRKGYLISPTARRDLDDIWDYIAKDNPEAADETLAAFAQTFDLLAQTKVIGRDESRFVAGLRMFPLKRYLIYFLSNRNPVEIARILHSARDVETILANDYEN